MEILVCLEGSASTKSAIDVAIGAAQRLKATLVGLAVVDEPDIRAGAATSIGGSSFKKERDDALIADAHAKAQEWIDDFTARCRDAMVPARTLELRGRPAELILEEMQKHDLTVLGRHANFRFETQDRDSATRDRILKRAGKPMLVVPEDVRDGGEAVLCAYDGSAAAIRALKSFAGSGLADGCKIHVASVHDDGAIAFELATAGCELLAGQNLSAAPDNIVSAHSIAEALLERTEKLDAGMIVLGGYIPSAFSRLLWGSVTHEMIEKTNLPVFVHY